jgi:sigma-B regulation protein RsbU (phosphoserine phosphatase)
MLRAVERVLAPQYELRSARLPSQALEAAARESFALALLDIRMPEMDGFELMARLVAVQPDLDVILMTGSTDERDSRLVRAIREKAFFFLTKPFDREVLITLVERCLDLHRLDTENRAHVARLERELAAARVFQQSLLPGTRVAGGGFEVDLHYEPCDELGGDFCDVVLDDAWPGAILLTDVSGHGAAAAMLTGMIKQAFHAAAPEHFAPGSVLQRILAASRLFAYARHLSAVCVRVHPGSTTIEYASAGHPPALILKPGGALRRLESSAPLIHPDLPEWHCEQRTARLERDESLLLYTDGLIEAMNAEGEHFGAQRLEAVARAMAGRPNRAGAAAADALAPLRAALDEFVDGRALDDDLTLALLRHV